MVTSWILALMIFHADGTVSQPPVASLDSEQECYAAKQAWMSVVNHKTVRGEGEGQSDVAILKCTPVEPEPEVKPRRKKATPVWEAPQ